MHLQCEFDNTHNADIDTQLLVNQLSDSLKQLTKLNGSVELVALGDLPDDGKVIDDQRVIA